MMDAIGADFLRRCPMDARWQAYLAEEFEKPYFAALCRAVDAERARGCVFPPEEEVFSALNLTPPEQVRCVILGQDPYHEPGQAHGLSFSVREGTRLPPSLQNIYKELESDIGIAPSQKGDLTAWAQQGVLLLNTVLTVRRGQANSHKGMGWEIFTDEVIRRLNEHESPIAFILWGANARSKKSLITNSKHGIFESAHPSPLSAYNGFFGSRVFSRVNRFLVENEIPPINWKVK